jgi:hypothetical protein
MHVPHIDALHPHARSLAAASLEWTDRYWDERFGLIWAADTQLYEDEAGGRPHLVRETGWYALGLLLRDGPQDRERAVRALETLLQYQFDAPGMPYHGTFYRAPEEPAPPPEPQIWKDYDPNWREFIGTTLALLLHYYEERLPAPLTAQIDMALRRAVEGTLARGVPASYTNIALMCAFLLRFAADRFGESAWAARGEGLAREIGRLFDATGAFEEYNSPTYYGVDLYALALWRSISTAPLLRELGARLEATLWSDIAALYHAGMRNLSGPFDRSYGMDLRRYASLLGMWIWLASGEQAAPFPAWRQPFDHPHDFCYGPCFAILGAQIPDHALPHLTTFQGQRVFERVITAAPRRVASAWLAPDLMLGGEHSGAAKLPSAQFHPATIYWRSGEELGWIRLLHSAPVDACAEPNLLTVTCPPHGAVERSFSFRVSSPVLDVDGDLWRLAGLTLRIQTSAEGPAITRAGEYAELRYSAPAAGEGEMIVFVIEVIGGAASLQHKLQ